MNQIVPFNDLLRQNSVLKDELNDTSARVIASGWYVLGTENQKFEQEFAAYCGSDHAIGLANGSDALELGLRALGVTSGSKVVTVANAGGYATTAIRSIGAIPLYIDVEPSSFLIDTSRLGALLDSHSTSAVVATHLFGRMCDMAPIMTICASRGVPVVEDCAQAHGAATAGRKAGTFGDMGCFSFYPTKNLGALGDGGAVVTSNDDINERVRSLRQYGWKSKYQVIAQGGRNSRLDEMQAAFLRIKLRYLDGWNVRRREIAARYKQQIRNPKLIVPDHDSERCVAHLFVVRCANREALREHLRAAGIGNDIHYPIPDHHQPGWRDLQGSDLSLPVTEQLAKEILSLPCYPELRDEEIDAVIHAVNRW